MPSAEGALRPWLRGPAHTTPVRALPPREQGMLLQRDEEERKTDDPADDELEHDDYIVRNGRKQVRISDASFDRRLYSEVPLTPGGGHGRSKP